MVKLKTVRTDEDIHDAVKGWIRSRHEAEVKYGPMPEWDTSKVTNMSFLFEGMGDFNEDISGWNVANVTIMERMFFRASAFNQPLDQWNVANVTTMYKMFLGASSFLDNAEQYPRPLWARNENAGLQRWKELYKLMAFKAVVVGEHVRADREKTDGSAAGVAVGAIAQVLTSEYLAAEILAFL